MTREESIKRFENQLKGAIAVLDSGFGTHPGESNRLYRDRKEMAQFAIAALREQEERENPKPLTLDELREMDGEPVWIKAKHFGVYADIVHFIGKEEGTRYLRFKINYRLQENGYGNTWIAYRSKPKGEQENGMQKLS